MLGANPEYPPAPVFPLTAAFVAAVNAALVTVTTFGVALTAQQESAISGLTNAFVILVLAASHAYRSVRFARRLDHQGAHIDALEANGTADTPPPSSSAPAAG